MTDHKPALAQKLTRPERLYRHLWTRGVARERAAAIAHDSQPQPQHLLTGERGEDEAYFHLRRLGWHVVARRWTTATARGDLDLVAWDGNVLVIVEVKTRTSRDGVAAEFAVDHDKRTQLRKLTFDLLRAFPLESRRRIPVRFDVVSVYLLPGSATVERTPDVFALRSSQ